MWPERALAYDQPSLSLGPLAPEEKSKGTTKVTGVLGLGVSESLGHGD